MSRIPYWNIQYGIIIDLMGIPVFCLLGYGFYRYWMRIRVGKDRIPMGLHSAALKIGPLYIRSFLTRGILGVRIYEQLFSGITHGCLFWGMGLLFVGTVLVMLNVLFGLPIFEGRFNQWFMAFTLDTAGLMALIGVLGLLVNRLSPLKRLAAVKLRKGFIPMEMAIIGIIVSGFFLEGLRIANTASRAGRLDRKHGCDTGFRHSRWPALASGILVGTWPGCADICCLDSVFTPFASVSGPAEHRTVHAYSRA